MVFVHYLPGTGKENKVQMVQPSYQETVPGMCGGWPPALEDCEDGEVYKASMLLLFNPWRNLKKLKKNAHDSFGKAFAEFEGRSCRSGRG
jgi:hypothetical protein